MQGGMSGGSKTGAAFGFNTAINILIDKNHLKLRLFMNCQVRIICNMSVSWAI